MSDTVGVQSLPPEILTVVFIDVVESAIPNERSWTALKLTHVCEPFRRVALDCPRLWTCLSRKLGRPGLALIEACIERSKDQPLDVVLYRYAFQRGFAAEETLAVDSIAPIILPVCGRWRRYSTVLVMAPYSDSEKLVISPIKFDAMSSNLNAPLVAEYSIEAQPELLDVFRHTSVTLFHMTLPPASSWSLPGLHSLIAQNPHMSAVLSLIRPRHCAQLRSATVGYAGQRLVSQLNSLRVFTDTTSLTKLRLSFNNCRFSKKSMKGAPHELQHVKSLHIDLLDCSQSAWSEHGLWKSFRKFKFPGVVDLTVLLDIGNPTFKLRIGHRSFDSSLHSLIVTDAEPRYLFSSLETLNVEVRQVHGDEAPELLLPHCCTPSLKHLRIRGASDLTLSDNIGEFDEALLPRHFLLGDEVVPLALQTITLDLPGVGGVVQWVKELVLKMKEQLCWDDFGELTVKNGGNRPRVIPRDEVDSWCDENHEDGLDAL